MMQADVKAAAIENFQENRDGFVVELNKLSEGQMGPSNPNLPPQNLLHIVYVDIDSGRLREGGQLLRREVQ